MHPASRHPLWIPVMLLLCACAADPAPHDDFMAALVASALAESQAAALPPPALPPSDSAPDIVAGPDCLIDSIRWHGDLFEHQALPRLLAPHANDPPL